MGGIDCHDLAIRACIVICFVVNFIKSDCWSMRLRGAVSPFSCSNFAAHESTPLIVGCGIFLTACVLIFVMPVVRAVFPLVLSVMFPAWHWVSPFSVWLQIYIALLSSLRLPFCRCSCLTSCLASKISKILCMGLIVSILPQNTSKLGTIHVDILEPHFRIEISWVSFLAMSMLGKGMASWFRTSVSSLIWKSHSTALSWLTPS